MREYLSSILPSSTQIGSLSSPFLTLLNLMLMYMSLQANMLVVYGPAYVIARFVLGQLLPGFNLISAALAQSLKLL